MLKNAVAYYKDMGNKYRGLPLTNLGALKEIRTILNYTIGIKRNHESFLVKEGKHRQIKKTKKEATC